MKDEVLNAAGNIIASQSRWIQFIFAAFERHYLHISRKFMLQLEFAKGK